MMSNRKQEMIMGTKEKYFIPTTEVQLVNTVEIMHVSNPTDTPVVPGAPERKDPAF